MISKIQFSWMTYIKAEGEIKASKLHTTTLASLLRKGYVETFGRQKEKNLCLTKLGIEEYEFRTTNKIRKWKEDLERARNAKGMT